MRKMSTYPVKKKHIYDYRRRKRALNYIRKLGKIIEESSTKDLKKLLDEVNALYWNIQGKLGFWEGFNQKYELEGDELDKKIKTGESELVDPIAYYICRKCGRKGYLFSPNIDEHEHDLYILHIIWDEKKAEFCYLGKTKTDQILILTPPIEGILTSYLIRKKRERPISKSR